MKFTPFLVAFVVFALHVACRQTAETLWIEPLPMFKKVDSSVDRGKVLVSKYECFIVHGFVDNMDMSDSVDALIENSKAIDFSKYRTYQIYVYRYSDKVNIERFEADRRNFDDEDTYNSLLYVYSWNYGERQERRKYKNYEMIEPKSNIKLEDIPQQK